MSARDVRLAVLNSMTGAEIERSVEAQVELGLRDLDLKDGLYGKGIVDLSDDEAAQVRTLADTHGMAVHCLSTQLFGEHVERGEEYFRDRYLGALDHVVGLVEILRPRMVRLLATQARDRPAGDLADHLADKAAWLSDQYRQAIDTIADTGVQVTIENEVNDCVLTGPDEVESFFAALDRAESVCFTWDVQNMWSLGTPPSVDLYRRLRPLIGYVHLKGGRANGDGALEWRSSLRDATWPIEEILREVIADGVSPVVCLNPSHGKAPEGWDGVGVVADDVRYLRELSIGVA